LNALGFVAAERREFDGIVRLLTGVRRMRAAIDYLAEGQWEGRRVVLAANGPGPRLAREAVAAAGEVGAWVSTGYCGALDARLSVGDILVATVVNCWTAAVPDCPARFLRGPIVSQDRVVGTAWEKRELAATGAVAVEMEAAGVAAAAHEQGVPFYCIRVVTDGANEDMPMDFNRYRRPDGRFSRGRIALAAMGRPKALASLIRFGRRCEKAAIQLGEGLAGCRF
jgi:nucleoside phosphorylase